ncbi:MAG TPA: Uma2 family endonuclease, partial [Acidobacteriota bacterium]|nr:Uma2 family endonuclease [Acidobacteriota bacterium]
MSTGVLSPPPELNVGFVLPLVLHAPKLLQNDEYFFEFCQMNPDWRIERTAQGDIEFMPPTGGRAGNTNATVTVLLGIWAFQDGTGKVFD